MKRLVLCVIAFGWTLNQQSGPEIRTDLFKRSIISKCGYICCSSLYILFNEKITFSAMLFTRILLGLELDHLLAHLAVLEQQHLPDCQERSLSRKSWRKLVLVATKRRREAIKRNFSQPASLTSYSGENFGAEFLLTAELGKVTKQRTGSHWQKMKTMWYKWTQSWTLFGAWSMDWGSETSLSRSSHFIFLHGQRHWPVAKKYKAWNMEYPLKNATLQLLQARSKCCHNPYSLNIIQCATIIPTNIDNSSIKCRFFVSGSGKQIQYSAFYTFTASGVIGSISDRSKSTIFQQEARYCYDLLIYQLN